VTPRKKKIIIIQSLLLLATIVIFYSTYYSKDDKIIQKIDKEVKELEAKKENVFFNVEYKGLDLNGNRYVVKSEEAKFDDKTPELVNMKIMAAIFYFKDGTKLTIQGNSGSYNSLTKDMRFEDDILSTYLDYVLNSDNLDFFNKDNYLEVYGNVYGKSSDGNLVADSLKFDISNQTLKISMFDNNKVNVNLKK
tara:strand:+ start:138 stop:716 length:579 start_codon:yes stop_codon:yes gene_type:complete